MFDVINSWNGFDFTWALRKQPGYKQATRGPTALGNEDKVPCQRVLLPLPARLVVLFIYMYTSRSSL